MFKHFHNLLFNLCWGYCEKHALKRWNSYCYVAKKDRLAVFCDRDEYGLFLAFAETMRKQEETVQ